MKPFPSSISNESLSLMTRLSLNLVKKVPAALQGHSIMQLKSDLSTKVGFFSPGKVKLLKVLHFHHVTMPVISIHRLLFLSYRLNERVLHQHLVGRTSPAASISAFIAWLCSMFFFFLWWNTFVVFTFSGNTFLYYFFRYYSVGSCYNSFLCRCWTLEADMRHDRATAMILEYDVFMSCKNLYRCPIRDHFEVKQ